MSFQFTALGGKEQPPPSLRNRRATVRYLCAPATSGRLVVVEKQEMQRAWVLDLSLGGVGLLLSRPLEAGLLVVIRLKSSEGGKVFELPAHVARSTKQSSGDWTVGCEFVTRLTPDEMETLL
jgi:hypothetical protein